MPESLELQSFLVRQSQHARWFIVRPLDETRVSVSPFLLSAGVLLQLTISVPTTAIAAVTLTGAKVEVSGEIADVVSIDFVGDIGEEYNLIFAQLLSSYVRPKPIVPQQTSGSRHVEMPINVSNLMQPMRDWCGWHWPVSNF